MMHTQEQLQRWRLILGADAAPQLEKSGMEIIALDTEQMIMDEALAAIYDNTAEAANNGTGGSAKAKGAGLGSSSIRLAKWLGDIRKFFPQDVVSVIQSDAIERKGLSQLMLEPETLESVKPDIGMVATLLAMKGKIPERSKESARRLIREVVEEIKKRLEQDIRQAVTGALNRREHSVIPSLSGIDWKRTISRNLKNHHAGLGTIIPERFYFFNRKQSNNNWTIILDIDQSGSMAESIIYSSIISSIFASIPALKTHVVAFDTNVVDLSEECQSDPVDLLFGFQLGGGTDINKSIQYCEQFVTNPSKTIFILISDLIEGGNEKAFVRRMAAMKEAGVRVICLLALSDSGTPSYDDAMAKKLNSLEIPCFACTPSLLPEFFEGALKGFDLMALAKRVRK